MGKQPHCQLKYQQVCHNTTETKCSVEYTDECHHVKEPVCKEYNEQECKTDTEKKCITFINRDTMGDTITGIHDNTSSTSGGIEGENSLDGNIHCRHVEGFKHDLSHLLTVSFGVEGSLSEENRLFLRGNTELIIESMMPDLLHIIPVGDDTMLHWILESKDTSLGLCLISNIGILLTHTNHHTLVAGTSNNGGEDSTWGIITSEASLAHARAIVNDKSSNVFVTHLGFITRNLNTTGPEHTSL